MSTFFTSGSSPTGINSTRLAAERDIPRCLPGDLNALERRARGARVLVRPRGLALPPDGDLPALPRDGDLPARRRRRTRRSCLSSRFLLRSSQRAWTSAGTIALKATGSHSHCLSRALLRRILILVWKRTLLYRSTSSITLIMLRLLFKARLRLKNLFPERYKEVCRQSVARMQRWRETKFGVTVKKRTTRGNYNLFLLTTDVTPGVQLFLC